MFNRELIDESSKVIEFTNEMMMEKAAQGFGTKVVAITYQTRSGETTLESFRDGWFHVKFMLVNAPGYYLFSIPGAVITVAGMVLTGLAFFKDGLALTPARMVTFVPAYFGSARKSSTEA